MEVWLKDVARDLGWSESTPIPEDFRETLYFVTKLMGEEVRIMFFMYYEDKRSISDIARELGYPDYKVKDTLCGVISNMKTRYIELLKVGLKEFMASIPLKYRSNDKQVGYFMACDDIMNMFEYDEGDVNDDSAIGNKLTTITNKYARKKVEALVTNKLAETSDNITVVTV